MFIGKSMEIPKKTRFGPNITFIGYNQNHFNLTYNMRKRKKSSKRYLYNIGKKRK